MSLPTPPEAIELHSEASGQGRPVVLLHGYGGSSYSWRHVRKALEPTHRVITLDLKGFGASPKPRDGAYAPDDQTALVCQFLRRHDLRDLVLVGHSFGGGVALLTALQMLSEPPCRIAKLVLIDSAGVSQRKPAFLRLLRIPIFSRIGVQIVPMRGQARKILRLAYHQPQRISDAQVDAYAAPLSSPGARYALWKTAQQIVPPFLTQITARYPTIDLPTLLIWGRYDRITPLKVARSLNQMLPRSRLVVLDDCGHIPHEEVPDACVNELSRFLVEAV